VHRFFLIGCLLLGLAACAPRLQSLGPEVGAPRLATEAVVTADGLHLPLTKWPAAEERAVVVALHGFNDYRLSFATAAAWWAEHGVTTYAYDQRGFGQAPAPGIIGGAQAMAADARAVVALAQARHAGKPVYLLGNSMGGAVALLALSGPEAPAVDGLVLVAPAVWGARAMSPFYRFGLWLWAHLTPGEYVTGRGLDRLASDNIPMLRALGRDPLVIKKTRIDALYGLTKLMGAGLEAATAVDTPALVLYGARDEIVPPAPVKEMAGTLNGVKRLALYADGWHMLLRDCQAETVWRDVATWIADAAAPLPSGAEVDSPNAINTSERGPVAEACASA
jgi:alpha-beta hydrolase superfamily lysophospholipase